MSFWRKKPVIVEAVQLLPENDDDVLAFLDKHRVPFVMVGDHEMVIRTLEGDMKASKGDWLIRGVAGECYPCKPDIFDLTYDPAT